MSRKLDNSQCLAPQILMKNPAYSYKCDIWSFGVLCYFMASRGKFPFKLLKKESEELSVLKKECPKGIKQEGLISAELKDLIEGCLKFEEADRFCWSEVFSHPYFMGEFEELSKVNFGQFFEYNFVFSVLRRLEQSGQTHILSILKSFDESIS